MSLTRIATTAASEQSEVPSRAHRPGENRAHAWDVVQALARHANGLEEAEDARAQIEAIRSNRLLLAEVDRSHQFGPR
jgi:hypothetical protein